MMPANRKMVVVRAPGTDGKPMIRIANNLLADVGFEIGDALGVSYQMDKITISKLDNQNERNHIQATPKLRLSSN